MFAEYRWFIIGDDRKKILKWRNTIFRLLGGNDFGKSLQKWMSESRWKWCEGRLNRWMILTDGDCRHRWVRAQLFQRQSCISAWCKEIEEAFIQAGSYKDKVRFRKKTDRETYVNEFSAITFVKESNGIIRLRGPIFFLLINQRPVHSEQRNVKMLMNQLHWFQPPRLEQADWLSSIDRSL
jgi:hypothetical protein